MDEAATLLTEMEASTHNVLLSCERGHGALTKGLSARDFLKEAKSVMQSLPHSVVPEEIDVLERACVAFEEDRPLVHGQCARDFS